MTKIKKTMCDQCEKETKDHYDEVGWITISGYASLTKFQISIQKGRDERGQARYRWTNGMERLDFCNTNCLITYLNGLK